MIRIIYGEKGAGKTKRIIDMANNKVNESKGSLIFIDDDNRYMFDLKHEIRFVDASEYMISDERVFFGFVCGMAAQDFDLEAIFIDGFLKIVRTDIHKLEGFFADLDAFSERNNLQITVSINGDPKKMPEFLKPHLL